MSKEIKINRYCEDCSDQNEQSGLWNIGIGNFSKKVIFKLTHESQEFASHVEILEKG